MTSPARTPLLVVADDDTEQRGLIEAELLRRYGADYTIRICTTAELGVVLDEAEANGDDIALALASGKEGQICSPACEAASRPRGAAS